MTIYKKYISIYRCPICKEKGNPGEYHPECREYCKFDSINKIEIKIKEYKLEERFLEHKILGDKNKCWYCDLTLEWHNRTKDHFWPKSKGGVLKVYCCNNCNAIKGNKTPLQFIELINNKINNKLISNELGKRIINKTLLLWQ